MTDEARLRQIIEGLLMAAGKPLEVDQIAAVFTEQERPDNDAINAALADIEADCEGRGFELKKVASGYRFQVRQELAEWVSRLWEEKPQKYSRALLETLSIIAYRQPITRGDIEKIRGVAVSTGIIRTLHEREWIRVVGHRDVPGRPAMYATTRQFLDYFNLDSLEDLPPLSELRDMEEINQELTLEEEPQPEGRVLEVPDEEEAQEETREDGQLPEEDAAEMAAKPLEEFLQYSDEPEAGGEDSAGDDDSSGGGREAPPGDTDVREASERNHN